MTTTSPSIVDLRQQADRSLLALFVELYKETFGNPALREDPSLWSPRLWGDPPEPEPILHVIVAVDKAGQVLGGVVAEYYRASCCGLVTYLAVREGERRRGIGRRLGIAASHALQADASQREQTLRAVFAEAEAPSAEAHEGSIDLSERLTALKHLGACRVGLDYVQPDLGSGAGRVRDLVLLAFPRASSAAIAGALPQATVFAFLLEFYQSLGVVSPEIDGDFRSMTGALQNRVKLIPL